MANGYLLRPPSRQNNVSISQGKEHMLILISTGYSWSLLIGLIVVVAAGVAAWLFSPKGENQTYVVHIASYFSLSSCIAFCSFILRPRDWDQPKSN
ncbi:hypothetical protein BJX65DRAFT_93004 [Aspergillus insuetus]